MTAGTLLAMSPVVVSAGEAVDCKGWPATIVGTEGDDVLNGTDGADVIVGLGGDDIINGGKGHDIICGNKGKDVIRGNMGSDRIFGGYGADEISGGRGNDRIRGQAGDDSIWGGVNSDVCIGESESSCELNKRWGHDPDDWLPLLEEYFGDIGETANARIVLGCESLGEPFIVNPASGTTGLFQYRDWVWDWMNPLTPGWEGEVRQHPEASIATARRHYDWALDRQGYGFKPWVNCGCHPDIDTPEKPADCPYTP